MVPADLQVIQIKGTTRADTTIRLQGKDLTGVLSVDLNGVNGVVLARVHMVAEIDVLATYDVEAVAESIVRCRTWRADLDSSIPLLPGRDAVFARAATFPPIPGQPVPLIRVQSGPAAAKLTLTFPDQPETRLIWTGARTVHMDGRSRWAAVDLWLEDGTQIVDGIGSVPNRSQRARDALALAEKELWRLLGDRSD